MDIINEYKFQIAEMVRSNNQAFIKALISLDTGLEDPEQINRIYSYFIQDKNRNYLFQEYYFNQLENQKKELEYFRDSDGDMIIDIEDIEPNNPEISQEKDYYKKEIERGRKIWRL